MAKVLLLGLGLALGFLVAWAILPGARQGQPLDTGASPDRDVVASLARGPQEAAQGLQTLADVFSLPGYVAQQAELLGLARDAGEARVLALLSEAEELSPRQAAWAMPILYARYAEIDGAAALDYARQSGALWPGGQQAMAGLFLAWMRVDREAALGALAGLPRSEQMQISLAMVALDPHLREADREQLAARFGLSSFVQQIDMAWHVRLSDDPARQLQEVLADPNAQIRQMKLQSLMSQWAQRDPQAAIAGLEQIGSASLRRQLQQQALGHWAQQDLAAALAWVATVAEPRLRQQYRLLALQSVAATDPEQALAAVDGLAAPEQAVALSRVLANWGMMQPRAAAQWLASVDDPQVRQHSLTAIARGYARQHPEEVLGWLDGLPGADQSMAVGAIVDEFARHDPEAAAALLDRIDDPVQRQSSAQSLAYQWARQDPQPALTWIADHITGDQRPRIIAQALGQWAQYEQSAALRYLDRLESVAEREAAVVAIIPSLMSEPARVERYFDSLTLPDMRRQAARQLYSYWRQFDPPRAESYREAAGFSDQELTAMEQRQMGSTAVFGARRAFPVR